VSDNIKDLEKRSAQAMLAMFVQVSSSVELARALQASRERALERRMTEAKDVDQITRLQYKLDALQTHSATIEHVSQRLRGQAENVAKFADAGLTMRDFQKLGVDAIVGEEELKAAIAKQAGENASGNSDEPVRPKER
jgi:hypothetical protein